MGRDRRRYLRVGLALGISVNALGRQWQAKTIALSPYGVKITLPAGPATLPAGTIAELQLSLPDEQAPLVLGGRVVRTDPDGVAFNFVNLSARRFSRLKHLVDSLIERPSDGSASLDSKVRLVKDRRRSSRADVELEVSFDDEQPYGWQGSKLLNLGLHGIKVALPRTAIQPAWGTTVKLRLSALDGGAPILLKGIVWRREPDGIAVLLVEVGRAELERLKALVESLQTSRRCSPRVLVSH